MVKDKYLYYPSYILSPIPLLIDEQAAIITIVRSSSSAELEGCKCWQNRSLSESQKYISEMFKLRR